MSRVLFDETIIDAQSALDTVGLVASAGIRYEAAKYSETAFYIAFGAGTSAGAVVIETAATPDYTGTWANLSTITWSAASKTHHVAITGVFRALRARISTAIVGGTVTVVSIGIHQ